MTLDDIFQNKMPNGRAIFKNHWHVSYLSRQEKNG
jgi:hypothetical protein